MTDTWRLVITQDNTVFCVASLLAAFGHWEHQIKRAVVIPHLLPSFWILSSSLHPRLKGKGAIKGTNANLSGLVTCSSTMKLPSWSGKGTSLQWHCWLGEKGKRQYLVQASQFCTISLPSKCGRLTKADEYPPTEGHFLTAWLLGNVNPLLNKRGRKTLYKSNPQFCKLIFVLQVDEKQQIFLCII